MTPDRGDPEEELASELRQRLGDEFRAEAEEGERLAELARLRGRDLAAVTGELRDRGDRVRVFAGGRSFTGVVVDVGRDRCALETPGGRVEIRLEGRPVHVSVEEPAVAEPPPRRTPATTFRARLRELELEQPVVEVGGDGPTGPLRARVVAVAEDHLVLEDGDGTRSYLGWEAIAYIVLPEDR